ncbi:MAG: patatin-like phospholipase family protein, partial [Marinirhabdus sp.]
MKTLPYILLLLLFAPARAQTPAAAQEDIKVGLVLSGGGAKGLAHVGAIKIIEQAGVRIDYIGGTSMGAVIGGLYASGYSGKQLDSILTAVDFDKLIQDYVPRNAKTFYEKNETDRYALTLPYDKFQLTLPSGFSKGQNFYNFLSKLTSHVSHVRDFDQLPIPFFCIATNAETGKEVLLEKGHLPKAIVASSALPTLFSPITINGTVMIDGGVVNNYPVDELRARGVDYIIGIDVQGSLKEKKQLVSAIAVLLQVNNYRTLEGMAAKRKRTDLYIHPDIKKFNVVGFDNALEIARAGEEKAGQYLKELEQIAKRQTARVPTGVPINTKPKIYIKRIEVEGNKNYTRSYIMGKLQIKAEDEIDHETFTRGVNNLTATGNFDEIDYRFVEETPGKHSLLLYVRESASKLFLRLGVHYDDLYRTAGLVNVTRKRLFTNNDIASLDLIVGDNLRYDLNYYIDKGFYWSVGFSSRFNFFDKDVPAQLVFPNMQAEAEVPTVFNRVNLEHSDVTNRLYVQTIFKRIFLLGAGVEHKWLQQLTKTVGTGMNSRPRTVFESTNYFSAYGYLKYDTYDNTFFPRQGVYFSGDFHLYLFAK